MSERIFLLFRGWCECNPSKVRFHRTQDPEETTISGIEWLALTDEDRAEYELESTVHAVATALDSKDEWSVSTEVW